MRRYFDNPSIHTLKLERLAKGWARPPGRTVIWPHRRPSRSGREATCAPVELPRRDYGRSSLARPQQAAESGHANGLMVVASAMTSTLRQRSE